MDVLTVLAGRAPRGRQLAKFLRDWEAPLQRPECAWLISPRTQVATSAGFILLLPRPAIVPDGAVL